VSSIPEPTCCSRGSTRCTIALVSVTTAGHLCQWSPKLLCLQAAAQQSTSTRGCSRSLRRTLHKACRWPSHTILNLTLFWFHKTAQCPSQASTAVFPLLVSSHNAPAGQWLTVHLKPNHVAVLAGHTLQHATAGAVQAADHRVMPCILHLSADSALTLFCLCAVASRRCSIHVYRGALVCRWQVAGERQVLAFKIRAMPSAVIDLRDALRMAGYEDPVSG